MKCGIIFDVDGTLWDSSYRVAESWDTVFRRHPEIARGVTRDDIMQVMGKSMLDIARQFFPTFPEDVQRQFLKECEDYEIEYLSAHLPEAFAGVHETLWTLAKEYPLFVVSNCQVGYIELCLQSAGVTEAVTDFACFGDNELPKCDNIRLVAERNGLERYFYVGDIQTDYDATVAAGGEFIFAAYGFGDVREDVPRIADITELPALMARLAPE